MSRDREALLQVLLRLCIAAGVAANLSRNPQRLATQEAVRSRRRIGKSFDRHAMTKIEQTAHEPVKLDRVHQTVACLGAVARP